jgi:nucleoside-diphosphate-sugar epimerase
MILLQTGQENIQPPIQWVVRLITTGWSGQEVKLTTHPPPPGLRMSGDTPPLPVRLYAVHRENSTHTFSLNAAGWYGMYWTGSRQGPVAGPSEHGIGSWDSSVVRQFLGRISDRPEGRSLTCSWFPEFIYRKKGIVTKTCHILLPLQSPHIRSYNVCSP